MSGTRWFCLLVGSPLLIFGGYLLYEKVYLSILTGESHERIGLVAKATKEAVFYVDGVECSRRGE